MSQVIDKEKNKLYYLATRRRIKKFLRRTDASTFFGNRIEMDTLVLAGKKTFNHPKLRKMGKLFYAHCFIDNFSRYCWAVPAKNRTAKETLKAIKEFITSLKPPFRSNIVFLQCDPAGEFKSKSITKFLEKRKIKQIFKTGPVKNQMVERLLRSLKQIIVQYMETNKGPFFWKDILKYSVNIQNNRYHRMLGKNITPSEVLEHFNEVQEKTINDMNYLNKDEYLKILKKLSEGKSIKDGSQYFKLGDWCLTASDKPMFAKETYRNYSMRPYQIVNILINRRPFMYSLKDEKGQKAKRNYYAKELKKIDKYPITGKAPYAKILKTIPDPNNANKSKRLVTHIVDRPKGEEEWRVGPRKLISGPMLLYDRKELRKKKNDS